MSVKPPTLAALAELTGGRLVVLGESGARGGAGELPVTDAAIDARSVAVGGMFMAVPGTRAHGASFAGQSAGSCVLTDEDGLTVLRTDGVQTVVLVVDDCRAWLGPVAAEIHGHPSRTMTVIGVTGTSGKTTTSYMVERMLLDDHSVGLIGTTGTRINGRAVPTSLTTPEAPTLQGLFARMRDEGVTHVVMEVSSHALVMGRVRGVDFDVAGFTNLSQDHLDFHPTMRDYFQAKSLLFTVPQDPGGELPTSVVCVDDEWGRELAETVENAATVTTTGGAPASWSVDSVEIGTDGLQHVTVTHPGGPDLPEPTFSFPLSLPGVFNVANAVVALACVRAAGIDVSTAAPRLGDVHVPGRMQAVTVGEGDTRYPRDFLALVDYAHKPGAVAAALTTLADQLERAGHGGRVGVVLGAGGNRDHEKRPLMGAEAAKVADLVIVTDDNPRDEEPGGIRAEVLAGARDIADSRGTDLREIGDRADAIRASVTWARRGDIVIVAGKGHETGQIVGDTVLEFDDVAVLAQALRDRQDRQEPTR
ncbi:MAG: UDP-N-acetylmuramoyl-L-alanyl-D-glutamate--2,6-diaminopimelate ligase [Corynebacterium sp.]|uniref:UDP-N-acetylmuramoyl-L-alanyl-D-glutamate--2, 6-diaminopimelate ligase n=1 Tax=Corynebacterium sp. TaxID=1720 RepID=UPI003F098719